MEEEDAFISRDIIESSLRERLFKCVEVGEGLGVVAWCHSWKSPSSSSLLEQSANISFLGGREGEVVVMDSEGGGGGAGGDMVKLLLIIN